MKLSEGTKQALRSAFGQEMTEEKMIAKINEVKEFKRKKEERERKENLFRNALGARLKKTK